MPNADVKIKRKNVFDKKNYFTLSMNIRERRVDN